MSIEAGVLYVVATPLGNLGDITYRAVQIMRAVDLIAAEDTRHSGMLLRHYGIDTPMVSLHEHNEQSRVRKLLGRLRAGESVALISDAGTPLISDPGYRLVAATRADGIRVSPVPGPNAAIAALSAAGLPTDRFVFEGFLPAKGAARDRRLRELAPETRTMVFYESSHRIAAALTAMFAAFGGQRRAALARELTKTFETLHVDTLAALCPWLEADADRRRGEFVLVVEGAPQGQEHTSELQLHRLLMLLLTELPVKAAARLAARLTGESRNKLYRWALELSSESGHSADTNLRRRQKKSDEPID